MEKKMRVLLNLRKEERFKAVTEKALADKEEKDREQ